MTLCFLHCFCPLAAFAEETMGWSPPTQPCRTGQPQGSVNQEAQRSLQLREVTTLEEGPRGWGMCLTPWTAALQKSGWHAACRCLQRVTEKKVVGMQVSRLNTAAPCASPETLTLLETGIRAPINTAVLQNSYYTANPSQRLGRPKR